MMDNLHPGWPRIKVFVLLGLDYIDDGSFWYRDGGLIVRSLRELGADAWLVTFGPELQSSDPQTPIITAPRALLADPAWWKAQAPYGVLFMLWGASRFEPIRQAARQATARVIERLDTNGVKSPRVWFWNYFMTNWVDQLDNGSNAVLAPALALGRTLALYALPDILDKKLTSGLSRMPLVTAESPIAVERVRRWIRALGFPTPRMQCIPHPVDLDDVVVDPAVERQNRVIAVGRWQDKVKNLPLVLKVLADFLALHPDWSALLVGRLPQDFERRLSPIPPAIRARLQALGPIPHDQLSRCYQSSKIYLLGSWYESFNIAAAEALCCGCSMVGPADIAAVPYFVAGSAAGTVACRRTHLHLLDALCAEAQAWNAGWRDTRQIASFWRQRVGSKSVAAQYLKAFAELPG